MAVVDFGSFTPSSSASLNLVQCTLEKHRFVQVTESISPNELRQVFPDALLVDMTESAKAWTDIFGPLAGKPVAAPGVKSLWTAATPEEANENHRREAWKFLEQQQEAFTSLTCSTAVLHSLPAVEAIERCVSEQNPFPPVLIVEAIAATHARNAFLKGPMVILLHSDTTLNAHLARLAKVPAKDYHVLNGPLYKVDDLSRLADLALLLFADRDEEVAGWLAEWLHEQKRDWRQDWVAVIRDLRVLMLPAEIRGSSEPRHRDLFLAAKAEADRRWDYRKLGDLAQRRGKKFLPTDENVIHGAYYGLLGMDGYDSGIVASALRWRVDGGFAVAPASWMVLDEPTASTPILLGDERTGPPSRYRSIAHAWFARELAFGMGWDYHDSPGHCGGKVRMSCLGKVEMSS